MSVVDPDLQIRGGGGGGGGVGHPDQDWGGAASKKIFFSPLGLIWSKNKGPLPLDPPLNVIIKFQVQRKTG